MEAMEMRLREVGVLDHDIRTRLNGPNKALVVTHKELVYADENHVQRADLREITKVATTSSGTLTVRTVAGPGIEGSIRGFDITELKFFFESVKTSVAQAKATLSSVRNTTDPWNDAPAAVPLGGSAGLNGLGRVSDSEIRNDVRAADIKPERQTLEMPPLDPTELADVPDLGASTRTQANDNVLLGRNTDAGHVGRTLEPESGVPAAPTETGRLNGAANRVTLNGEARPRNSEDSAVPWMRANMPSGRLSREEPTPKADAMGYALSNEAEAQIKNPSVVPSGSSDDWSGDVLDPKVSLEVKGSSAGTPGGLAPTASSNFNPTLIEAMTTLKPLARWLRIIGVVFVVVGLTAAVLSLPGEKTSNMGLAWVQVLLYAMGSFVLALMSFGLAELMIAASNIAADVRATRRATIGH